MIRMLSMAQLLFRAKPCLDAVQALLQNIMNSAAPAFGSREWLCTHTSGKRWRVLGLLGLGKAVWTAICQATDEIAPEITDTPILVTFVKCQENKALSDDISDSLCEFKSCRSCNSSCM